MNPRVFPPYELPCLRCGEIFVFDWNGHCWLWCLECLGPELDAVDRMFQPPWGAAPAAWVLEQPDLPAAKPARPGGSFFRSPAPAAESSTGVATNTNTLLEGGSAAAPVNLDRDDPKDEVADFAYFGRPWGKGRPFWFRLDSRLRAAAQEAWAERAAIMEYHGNAPRAAAEHRAYAIVEGKAKEAGLI